MLLTVRGFGVRILGLVGYLVLARLLTPHDFGVAALGLSLVFFAGFIADAGLGAALIRTPTEPTNEDYASVIGLQVVVTLVAVAAAAGWWAVARNTVAAVGLLYTASLPLLAFRLPSAIALERRLSYTPLVVADVAEVFVYTAWAIGAALAGFGVYGLASGAIVRTACGTGLLNWLGPIGWLRPALRLAKVRGLIGFGVKFQLTGAVTLARDQAVNVGTALLLGYPTLGLWTLTTRVLTVPFFVFDSLWRVSFPTFARMLENDEEVDSLMTRSVGSAGFIGGLLFVPMAIGLPRIVPAVIGQRWAPALVVLPYILLGLLASLPISVVASGFLLAKGAAGSLLRLNIGITLANLAVAFGLMPFIGYTALGLGQAAGSVVDGWLLSKAVVALGGPRLFGQTVPPMLSGLVAFTAAEGALRLGTTAPLFIVLVASIGAVMYFVVATATTPVTVRNALALIRTVRHRAHLT